MVDQAPVENAAQAYSLPVWVDHVSDFGEPGGRVAVVTARTDDPLSLGRTDDGCKRHLFLVVDAGEMLGRSVRERPPLTAKAAVHGFVGHPGEELLHSPTVSCSCRAGADRTAVA